MPANPSTELKLSVISLTILVVAYNNEATLEPTLDRLYRALSITVEDFVILVYDDGSTDNTFAVAQRACQDYPFTKLRQNPRRMGLGYCMNEAVAATETTFIVYVPGDNTWLLNSFIELFGHSGKADIVTSYSNNLLVAMPPLRRFLSRGYTGAINFLFDKTIRYYNGLTIYPVEYLRLHHIRSRGFGFQAEALLKAVSAGYSFLEIALSVDAENLLAGRAVTAANALAAGATILRLFVQRYISRQWQVSRKAGLADCELAAAGESRAPLRILICGASSGIGARLAGALARDGHRVVICARRVDRLEAVANISPQIETFVCDISDEHQVRRLADELSRRLVSLDVVINCAGGFGEIGPVSIVDSDSWWRTVEANLKGAYLIARCMLPLLQTGRQPRLINFSGGGAFSPAPNYSAYACSKAAIVRLTECLAAELIGANIRVNAIAPGFVPTEMHSATLAAGEERAGRLQFRRTQAILNQPSPSIENVINCVRMMISPRFDQLTGKTISSNFDPWQNPTFAQCISDIARSDIYTLRRINIVNLPDGWLRESLSQPWVDAAHRG